MIKTICLKWNIEVKKLNMFICKILSEILVNQQVMGPSGMEMDLSEIQIAHPTLGTNFRSLQCSWSQWDTTESQFEVFFLHCSDMYILLEPFQVDSHEGSSRKCQLKNMAGYQRPFCSTIRSTELPEWLAVVSEGPGGRETSCKF